MDRRLILIADDDVDALKLMGLMLERQGYVIAVAANGQQTIEKALEMQPSLIILDVMMPDMDGYQVAAKLRDHPATESIPILMFTARGTVSDRVAGLQAGVDDYLTKPVRPQELTARVETLLVRRPRPQEEPEQGGGIVVGFLPTKGGIGTSTLALNTSIELMRMVKETSAALVELQDGAGVFALQLGLAPPLGTATGLPALMDQPLAHLTTAGLRQQLARHVSGLHILPTSPEPAGFGPVFDRAHVRTIIRYLKADHAYVLLDLPPRLGEPQREALALCDQVILTIEPNRVGVALTEAMTTALEQVGVLRQKIRAVLIHRAPASGTISRTMIEQMVHLEMVAAIPPVPDLAYASIQNGKSWVEMQPQSLVSQQVRRVVQAIVED
jgi:CheY-like chemotaxis protein